MKLPKVIVLDFDGVIVESNEIKYSAFREVFKSYPQHMEEIIKYHKAYPAVDRYSKFNFIADNILKLSNSENIKKQWADDYSRLTRQAVVDCPFVFGALDFLEHFGSDMLYLASATPSAELNIILEQRDLKKYFKKIYGAPLNKADVLKEIQKLENVLLEEMLFIGDSPSDQDAAIKANVPFIGRRSDSALTAQKLFGDLKQIQNYILTGEAS